MGSWQWCRNCNVSWFAININYNQLPIVFYRAPERVTLYTWHRVLVNRRGKEATIRIDEGSVAQGRSLGPLSELNLDIPIFIGGLRCNFTLFKLQLRCLQTHFLDH